MADILLHPGNPNLIELYALLFGIMALLWLADLGYGAWKTHHDRPPEPLTGHEANGVNGGE